MADMYVRKFRPNKMHIIAAVFLLLSLILFVNGIHRTIRISSKYTMASLSASPENATGGSGVLLECMPVSGIMKGASQERKISCAFISDYEIMVVEAANKYRYAAVKQNSEEYKRLTEGKAVTGYFSDKYGSQFMDYISRMDKYYNEDSVIPENKCSEIGIIVVDTAKEKRSVFYGLPFLIIGILLLIKAGSPFFNFPVEKT